MDKIDLKIFKELDTNPKIYLTKLAKKCRISQQVADYRLKRMLGTEVIQKFGTIINLKTLGLEQYQIFFTLNSKYKHEDVFSYLKKEKGVYWAARTGGRYDLMIVLFVKDFARHDAFIDSFNKQFPNIVKEYSSNYATKQELFKHKYLNEDYTSFVSTCSDAIQEIDEMDNFVLSKIKNNCRISSVEIASKLKISYKTILNRIKLLEEKKIIQGYRLFVKSVNNKPFGVLVSFQNYSKEQEKKLSNYLSQLKSVTQIVNLYGQWSMFLHIRVKDHEELQGVLIDLRDKFSIIDSTETIPIFEDIEINLYP
jgi:Lrp/AsnC family transcriptional regulator, leucine-responsive regulatory protein